jgi:hypothetical protein
MAGLAILKHTCNLSEEAVCELWIENPYYQYFCGEEFFQHRLCARSLLDDPLAQSHGRRAAAGAVAGVPGGRNQDGRDEARRSRPRL